MPRKKTGTKKNIEEYELRASVATIVDFIRSKVNSTIVEASRKEIIKSMDDTDLQTLCNIVDATIGQAYTQSSAQELSDLYKKITK